MKRSLLFLLCLFCWSDSSIASSMVHKVKNLIQTLNKVQSNTVRNNMKIADIMQGQFKNVINGWIVNYLVAKEEKYSFNYIKYDKDASEYVKKIAEQDEKIKKHSDNLKESQEKKADIQQKYNNLQRLVDDHPKEGRLSAKQEREKTRFGNTSRKLKEQKAIIARQQSYINNEREKKKELERDQQNHQEEKSNIVRLVEKNMGFLSKILSIIDLFASRLDKKIQVWDTTLSGREWLEAIYVAQADGKNIFDRNFEEEDKQYSNQINRIKEIVRRIKFALGEVDSGKSWAEPPQRDLEKVWRKVKNGRDKKAIGIGLENTYSQIVGWMNSSAEVDNYQLNQDFYYKVSDLIDALPRLGAGEKIQAFGAEYSVEDLLAAIAESQCKEDGKTTKLFKNLSGVQDDTMTRLRKKIAGKIEAAKDAIVLSKQSGKGAGKKEKTPVVPATAAAAVVVALQPKVVIAKYLAGEGEFVKLDELAQAVGLFIESFVDESLEFKNAETGKRDLAQLLQVVQKMINEGLSGKNIKVFGSKKSVDKWLQDIKSKNMRHAHQLSGQSGELARNINRALKKASRVKSYSDLRSAFIARSGAPVELQAISEGREIDFNNPKKIVEAMSLFKAWKNAGWRGWSDSGYFVLHDEIMNDSMKRLSAVQTLVQFYNYLINLAQNNLSETFSLRPLHKSSMPIEKLIGYIERSLDNTAKTLQGKSFESYVEEIERVYGKDLRMFKKIKKLQARDQGLIGLIHSAIYVELMTLVDTVRKVSGEKGSGSLVFKSKTIKSLFQSQEVVADDDTFDID